MIWHGMTRLAREELVAARPRDQRHVVRERARRRKRTRLVRECDAVDDRRPLHTARAQSPTVRKRVFVVVIPVAQRRFEPHRPPTNTKPLLDEHENEITHTACTPTCCITSHCTALYYMA